MNLTPKQIQKIEEIAKKYHLKLVLLFGSQVSGSLNRESDVDIAYLAEKSLNFNEECSLNYAFTNIFQTDRVDTVDLRKAPPLLSEEIFKKHQILFCSDFRAYYLYKIYSFKRFIEAAPLFRLRDELINKYFSARGI